MPFPFPPAVLLLAPLSLLEQQAAQLQVSAPRRDFYDLALQLAHLIAQHEGSQTVVGGLEKTRFFFKPGFIKNLFQGEKFVLFS